jgi:hypothetical protein
MSKLLCTCGYVIADQTDFLPYKGQILKDEDEESFWSTISKELAALIESIASGKRQEWIDRHFSSGYPKDLDNKAIISDYLTSMQIRYQVTIYECESCGRLWIEEGTQRNLFISYSPDDGERHQILASEHRNRNGDAA